jgi:flagellar motor switch/type III secretory pathway protein FliN
VESREGFLPTQIGGFAMAAPAAAREENEVSANPEAWAQALTLSCKLTLDMPLPGFRVADLLGLRPRSVINSHWRAGADVPLRVNGKVIACGEFEVVGDHLAVRLTELA